VYRYGISFNKVFDYLAAERPVVFACDSAYDPVSIAGAGVTIRPDDPRTFANACLELAAKDPGELARMGTAGRAYVVQEHNVATLGGVLASALEGR
jgi:glycosyltransferase involved in cell wall biosynthesis